MLIDLASPIKFIECDILAALVDIIFDLIFLSIHFVAHTLKNMFWTAKYFVHAYVNIGMVSRYAWNVRVRFVFLSSFAIIK